MSTVWVGLIMILGKEEQKAQKKAKLIFIEQEMGLIKDLRLVCKKQDVYLILKTLYHYLSLKENILTV